MIKQRLGYGCSRSLRSTEYPSNKDVCESTEVHVVVSSRPCPLYREIGPDVRPADTLGCHYADGCP
jgi:hypothetical protein